MKSSDEIFIGPSPLKLFLVMAGGGLGVIVGVCLIVDGALGRKWLLSAGWIVAAVVSSIVLVGYLLSLFRGRPSVEMDLDGFSCGSLFGTRTRAWRDIEGDFVQFGNGLQRGIGYRLTPAFKEANAIKPTTLFAGNDEAISGAYTVSHSHLTELLNQHKKRVLAKGTEPS